MKKFLKSLGVMTIAVLLTVGCKPKDDADPDTTDSNATDSDADSNTTSNDADAEIKANLAKLNDADRAIAEKQKLCPVSDKPLGGMGTPYKVSLEGKDVFLCCDGCEGTLKEDPEKYLAKLPE